MLSTGQSSALTQLMHFAYNISLTKGRADISGEYAGIDFN